MNFLCFNCTLRGFYSHKDGREKTISSFIKLVFFYFGTPCYCILLSFLTLRLKLGLLVMEGMVRYKINLLKGRLFLTISSPALLCIIQSPDLIHLTLLQALEDKKPNAD